MMSLKKNPIKHIIQPFLIITFAILVSLLMVSIIAYINCAEAQLFFDNLLEQKSLQSAFGQV